MRPLLCTRTPSGSVYSENVGGSRYYFAFDGLGSVVGLFNSSGSLVSDYTAAYEPYGNLVGPLPSGYPAFDYRFAGYWFDTSAGLYKVGARYYDPNTSRWTQRDPIDNPLELSGWNRYAYAGEDPVNLTDPSGMCFLDLCHAAGIVHAIGSAAGIAALGCGIAAVATEGAALAACGAIAGTISSIISAGEAAKARSLKPIIGSSGDAVSIACHLASLPLRGAGAQRLQGAPRSPGR